MAEEKDGYILDVIANLQKSLTSESKSNEYLRGELKTLERIIEKQTEIIKQCDINTENLNAKNAELRVKKHDMEGELSKLKEMNKELLENITILRQALKTENEAYNALAAKSNDEFPLQ
jgi:chromosome segregation ATPase